MRFTLDPTAMDGIRPGMARLASALSGGGQTEQQAFDTTAGGMSKLAAAIAAAHASDAQAAEAAAKTVGIQRANDLQAPGAIRDRALMASGIPLDAGGDVDQFARTGRIDRYTLPASMPGPTMPAPAWAASTNLGQALGRVAAEQSVIGGGAKGADDYYKGQQQQFETNLARGLVDGTVPAGAAPTGMALLKALPVFAAHEFGTSNNYTGALDTSTPAAQNFAGYRKAETGAQNAAADKSRAEASKARTEGGLDGKNGKAPPGYVWGPPDANGTPTMIAVKGGPADLKMQGAFNQDTATLTGTTAAMDRLATAANEVLHHPGVNGITGWRGSIPNAPGTDAANAEALLGTLKSQVGFGVLQDLRNNSKTGGALGAVSDAEGKRLEANLAALDKSQSLDQFKSNLGKIIQYTEQAKDRMRQSFNLKHGDQTPAAPAAAPTAPAAPAARTIIRTGTLNGKRVVQYSDGTADYAN